MKIIQTIIMTIFLCGFTLNSIAQQAPKTTEHSNNSSSEIFKNKRLKSLSLTEQQIQKMQSTRNKLEGNYLSIKSTITKLDEQLKQELITGNLSSIKTVMKNQHQQKQLMSKAELDYSLAIMSILNKEQMNLLATKPRLMKKLLKVKGNIMGKQKRNKNKNNKKEK